MTAATVLVRHIAITLRHQGRKPHRLERFRPSWMLNFVPCITGILCFTVRTACGLFLLQMICYDNQI